MNRSRESASSFRLSLFAVLAVALLMSHSASAANWSDIQPTRSTESQVFTWFGAPTEVVAIFPWQAWAARADKSLVTKRYTFRYESGSSNSSLLDGPAGPADSVSVSISRGFAVHVEWQYSGPTAKAAARTLRSDPELKFSASASPCYASKALPNGRVYAELGVGDLDVRVYYDLK